MKESFDVVVCGGGSAGCALAARLSEDPHRRVLLLEAGPRDWNPLIRVPLMAGVLWRSRARNWSYWTEPEPNLMNRRIFHPRGKVLGGSSAINGMVYARGFPSDYDSWAARGNEGWSFKEVLPYFVRSERHFASASEAYRGTDGPLPVGPQQYANPLFDAFLEAGRQAGYGVTADFNADEPTGFGRYDFTIWQGERWSTARAYITPLAGRKNLRVVTGVQILSVPISAGRATGVEVLVGRTKQTFHCSGEVVLACGALGSPSVLMRSGIGDPGELRKLGVAVKADLPGVGKNLQDHLIVRVSHRCREPITLYSELRADKAALSLARALLFKSGPASVFPLLTGAFFKSSPDVEIADVQSHFMSALSSSALRLPLVPGRQDGHGFFANVCQLRPESRGSVSLRSLDPNDAPIIRANYLSSSVDRKVLLDGVKRLREVFAQPAFDRFRGDEIGPGYSCRTDEDLTKWIANTADTVFHPVGTCQMGVGENAVVDPSLRVRGISGLRVADASVMPTIPSANTNASSIMIGEKCADLVANLRGTVRSAELVPT